MSTTEETLDLKEVLSVEDLAIPKVHELRRAIHLNIERRGEFERLLEDFSSIAKRLSSENKAEARRAIALWILGRVEAAVPILEAARASKEKAYFLGISYLDLGRVADAVAQLKEAHESDNADPAIAGAYAEALTRSGEYENADRVLEKMQRKFPEHADLHYARGLWRDLQGFREEALESYEKAMELEPGHARSLFRLAYIYDLFGEDARALEYYEQLRTARPLHVNTIMNLGVLYDDNGEYDKAVDCFRSVLDYYPTHARARLYYKDAVASINMFYDEDAARREAKLAQVLTQPLLEIGFSQRVRNGLTNLGCNTIADLAQKTEEDLLAIPNFGKTSLREVRDFLAGKGLSLSTGGAREVQGAVPGAPTGEPVGNVQEKLLSDFEWSGRIRKILERFQLRTVGDLLQKSEQELMETRNLGITSIKEIRRKLGTLGMAMRET